MNIYRFLHKMDNQKFFSDCHKPFKMVGIFVWGDAILFLPFHIILFLFSLLSLKFALLVWAVFFSIRNLGEVLYWFLQQFGDRKYRPYDFGFCNLDNHAIYIFYQTIMTIHATVSISALIIFILYWNVLPQTYGDLISFFAPLFRE